MSEVSERSCAATAQIMIDVSLYKRAHNSRTLALLLQLGYVATY